MSLYNSLRGCNQVGVNLFSQVTNDRLRRNGLELFQGKFTLDISKKYFHGRCSKCWNRLPREEVESPPLEVFKYVKMWCLGAWVRVELATLCKRLDLILKIFSNLNYSLIL